jgi:hypothetical protein
VSQESSTAPDGELGNADQAVPLRSPVASQEPQRPDTPGADSGPRPLAAKFAESFPVWGFLAAAIVIIRILSVAHFNPIASLGVVRYIDIKGVLLGLSLLTVPTALEYAALYCGLRLLSECQFLFSRLANRPAFAPDERIPRIFFIGPMFITLGIAIASVSWLVAYALAWGLIWPLFLRPRSRTQDTGGGAATGKPPSPARAKWYQFSGLGLILLGFALVGVGGLILAFDDSMWLPAERLTPPQGSAVVGYVLGSDGSELVVLREQDRTILNVSSLETKRELCQIDAWSRPPVSRLLWAKAPSLPPCT